MDAADCAAAIEKIERSDGARYGGRQFEFVGRSGVRKTPLPLMHTPRRYTAGEIKDVCFEEAKPRLTCAGTCTVVIAMLKIFPEADLPDPPKNPLGSSDVTTFHDLYLAADSVHHHCVEWLQQAGYQQEGKRRAPCAFYDLFSARYASSHRLAFYLWLLTPSKTTPFLQASTQPTHQMSDRLYLMAILHSILPKVELHIRMQK
ncbi:MAG: hypothetical protein L6R35_003244 [Caloplaca aegaea]|nr:MAG: hypothetical protein L6R35_003244 [Caloplaca aegaea]